jgi:hypothetical protein
LRALLICSCQLALLVDARHGLPPNLSGAVGGRATINHGLKALPDLCVDG